MTAQNRDIELLPQEDWEKTSWGKFIKWILTVGRYIVIFTELIVISAFISRFKLDHDLSQVYEDIERKQSLVIANQEFENNFRQLKARLETIQKVTDEQKGNQQILEELTPLMPIDVSLTNIAVDKNMVKIKAVALSEEGFATFITNLKDSPNFEELNMGNVTSGSDKTVGINFDLNCKYQFTEQEEEEENV